MDSDDLIPFAEELARAASAVTLRHFRSGTAIINKKDGGFDPVTEADRGAEKVLRSLIEARFPDHGIKGEEFPEKEGPAPYRWVLDPIDGTRAFICGAPVWTTLIALECEGRPIMGVIDQPFVAERWIGLSLPDGSRELVLAGALPKGVSGLERLADARLMVTDCREGEYLNAGEAAAIARLTARVRLLRQGLDSYGFGLVASGQMDLVVEAGLQWHDIAAVIPVIEAAGGIVTDWQGRTLVDTGGPIQAIIAATPTLAAAAAEALSTA